MRQVLRQVLVVGFVLAGLTLASACAPAPVVPEPSPIPALPSATVPGPIPDTPTPSAAATENAVFRIVPEESEARFLIDEVLWGAPTTVVGTTSEVTGEIIGALASPQSVAVGPIRVDLSTLRTDNSFRNRAIQDAILQTGMEANRFADFTMTRVDGLPSEVVLGTPYALSLVGELTIHGVTRTVAFDATVTPVSETRVAGTASLSLPYTDFDIHILRLPEQVASVGDIVTLEIDFVAEAG